MPPFATKNWVFYAAGVVAILASLIALNLYLARITIAPLTLGDYQSYRCEVAGKSTGGTFRILTLTSVQARELADELCALGGEYNLHAIEIAWHSRDFMTPDDVVNGRYDLFWNRLHLVQGIVPNLLNYYTEILDSPRYPLYWLTLDDNPLPDSFYFKDKTIGFLSVSNSQTFYQQPSAWLRNNNIELQDSQIRYYPGIETLLNAFARGEVDLISASPAMIRGMDIGPVQRLLINKNMESGTWFLREKWAETALACDLILLLKESGAEILGGEEISEYRNRIICESPI